MKHRLFTCIEPGPELRQKLIDLEIKLDKLQLPIDWELPEKLHLTINFIGKTDKDKIGELSSAISRGIRGISPFSLSPAFLETLYRKHDRSVIYIGLSGDTEKLKELQSALRRELINQKIPQPERFLPHITIGRVKKSDPVTTKSVLDKIQECEFAPLPDFTVEQISLYESILSKDDSHYRRVGRFSLVSA